MVWDHGPCRNILTDKDEPVLMLKAYEDGKLEVSLEGQKLSGGYALIRTGNGQNARRLMIKMDDDEADARWIPATTEPKSDANMPGAE